MHTRKLHTHPLPPMIPLLINGSALPLNTKPDVGLIDHANFWNPRFRTIELHRNGCSLIDKPRVTCLAQWLQLLQSC